MESRKDLQRRIQEAAVEVERAINKGRAAADKAMELSAQDNTSTMSEFDMFYKYYHYFTGLHFIKLAMPSDILFKNYTTEE